MHILACDPPLKTQENEEVHLHVPYYRMSAPCGPGDVSSTGHERASRELKLVCSRSRPTTALVLLVLLVLIYCSWVMQCINELFFVLTNIYVYFKLFFLFFMLSFIFCGFKKRYQFSMISTPVLFYCSTAKDPNDREKLGSCIIMLLLLCY